MDIVDLPIKEHPLRKRYVLLTIALILVTVWAVTHLFLFTPFGNRVLAPILQNKLTTALHHPITVQTFTLTLDNFELSFVDEANNSVKAQGEYTLIPHYIDAHYDANLSHIGGINPTKLPLQTNGTLQGTYDNLHLIGQTHLFKGRIDTDATLHFLSLDVAHLLIYNLPYQPLMDAFEYPHKSDTVLNGSVNISGIEKRNIYATLNLSATTHHFNPSPLKGNNESFDFWSLLADKEGKIAPFRINTDLNVSVDELGILEQFAHYPLRTPATLHTTLQGTQHRLTFKTTAFAAKGKIEAILELAKLRPTTVDLTLKHANAFPLFQLLSLPSPIKGNIDGQLTTDFTNSTIALTIRQGHTVPLVLKRHYHITQPLIAFNASMKVRLRPKLIRYTGTFKSDLEDLRFDGSPPHNQIVTHFVRQINHNRGLEE